MSAASGSDQTNLIIKGSGCRFICPSAALPLTATSRLTIEALSICMSAKI